MNGWLVATADDAHLPVPSTSLDSEHIVPKHQLNLLQSQKCSDDQRMRIVMTVVSLVADNL